MPKPYFLPRPSGLYVRFLVPVDLRGTVGTRFILRPLGTRRGDHARLVAAAFAVALSGWFEGIRRGAGMTDLKKLLQSVQDAADRGSIREWKGTGIKVGGVELESVHTIGRADTLDFLEFLKGASGIPASGASSGMPVTALTAPPSAAPPIEGPLLSAEIDQHLSDLARRQLSPDTVTESKHTLRVLVGVIGDMPVAQIKAAHVRAFWEAIRWWPANATVKPAYRGLTVKQIVARGKAENVTQPSAHTLNKHRQRLGVFFNGLVDMDLITKSPLKGTGPEIDTSKEMEVGRAFTPTELVKIFDLDHFIPWASSLPHRWWGPMLGLYTGARVNEVAQLYVDDVRQVDGVWGLFFWKNARNQKIKSRSSIRFVPLAQPLLDAGFLSFVGDMRAGDHLRMFPYLPAGTSKDGRANGTGYGRQLSRQFASYLKGFGIETGVAFHAFRHTLSTALSEDVDAITIATLTGHARPMQVPVLEKHYIHIADTKTLADRRAALRRFAPPVLLPIYTKGQFSKGLALRSELHP